MHNVFKFQIQGTAKTLLPDHIDYDIFIKLKYLKNVTVCFKGDIYIYSKNMQHKNMIFITFIK